MLQQKRSRLVALGVAVPVGFLFASRLLIVAAAIGGVSTLIGHTFASGFAVGIVLAIVLQELAVRWWRRRRPDLFADAMGGTETPVRDNW